MGEILWVNPAGTGDFDEDTTQLSVAVASQVHGARILHLGSGPRHLSTACASIRHSARGSSSCSRLKRTAVSRASSALWSRARDELPAPVADPGVACRKWAALVGDLYQRPGLSHCECFGFEAPPAEPVLR